MRVVYWLFFLFIQFSYGLDDNQFWTSIGFEKKLPYSLKLEFEHELRFKDQLSTFNQTFSEVSLSYKVFDGLNINIPYRYAIFNDKIKQRLSFSGSYKYSFKPISLKYRARFQRTNEKEKNAKDLIRNKFTIEYKLDKKIEPYVSGELLHLYKTDQRQLDEYRVSFGVAVDLPRKKSIKIFYTYKKEDITKSSPDKINIFGLTYNFKR
jgi:predicted porin